MKKRKLHGFMLMILLMTTSLESRTLFVSSKGNDSNAGTLVTLPLATVGKAIGAAAAGDTIMLLPGVYRGVISLESKNGLPEKPIVLCGSSKDSAQYPVIDGEAPFPSADAQYNWIVMNNSSWLEVSRLRFQNGWSNPIRVKNSSYVTFRHCIFSGAKHVIYATGEQTHHLLLEDCFWDQGGEYLWKLKSDDTGDSAWYSMHHGKLSYFNGSIIDFRGTGGSVVIRRNKVQNAFNAIRWVGKENMDANVEIYENCITDMRDNDFEPENYAYNLHIYHNVSHNIHKTLSIDNVMGGYIYYYGNVITTDEDAWTREVCNGFWKVYGEERKLSFPLYAFNNSFFGTGRPFVQIFGAPKYFSHFNNAYYLSEGIEWELNDWDVPTEHFDHDISNKQWPPNITAHRQELNGKIADILYVDPTHRDLHLKAGSPGIDAGMVVSLPEFEWTQTFTGAAPDIGAYENGVLVEGPVFRFRIPPGVELSYKEKPRIVRHSTDGNDLTIYFSDRIDPSSISRSTVEVFNNEEKLGIGSVRIAGNYAVEIHAEKRIDPRGISLLFLTMPKGKNGETATYWGSTLTIHSQH